VLAQVLAVLWAVLARLVQKRLWLRRVLKQLQMRQWHRLYLRQLWRLLQWLLQGFRQVKVLRKPANWQTLLPLQMRQ
jgi:hypothetical protein